MANLPNPIEQVDTRAELAKLAGVGERTYGKASAILNSNNEDVKNAVMSGEKSIDEISQMHREFRYLCDMKILLLKKTRKNNCLL